MRESAKIRLMPRELVHWKVLEEARRRLDPKSAVARVLQTHLDQAKIGAIAHDAPYYYKRGHDRFELLAEIMHGGEGEDTLAPMRQLSHELITRGRDGAEAGWATLLGMLSHIAADVVFHPMVFYFTGNYHDADPNERRLAQTRHRLLEVYIDGWMLRKDRPEGSLFIRDLLKRIDRAPFLGGGPLDGALNEKSLCVAGPSAAAGRWGAALDEMALYQRLFYVPILGAIFRGASIVAPKRIAPIDSLFEWRRHDSPAILNEPLQFMNPVTGEQSKKRLAQLLEEAIEETARFFRRWEPLMNGTSRDVEATVGDIVGASLNIGVVGAPTSLSRHFAAEGFSLPGLRIKSPAAR